MKSSLFPEREPASEARLDRFAVSAALRLRQLPGLRQRAQRRLLDGLAATRCSELGDAALRSFARQAAREAYAKRDATAGARALAALAEAARRSLGLSPHRPQLLACWSLIEGTLVELDTGEGKTLTAGLAASFAALAGVPAHVVTVNDYLAQRDAEAMEQLFAFFGFTVGVVHQAVPQDQRAAQYANDICYCTNKDLVFDYLRDRVNARGLASMAQMAVRQLHGSQRSTEPLRLRGLHFAIVDEADSVLIDEARTPLILSAKREGQADAVNLYAELLELGRGLVEGEHYELIVAEARVGLLPAGREHLAELHSEDEADDEVWRTPWMLEHFALQALRALLLFKRDQHYVVHQGKVVIVDEFTGRMLPDRSWEQGLQQLVEVKEGCAPSGGNVTLARITYQTFFSRYLRLAGMSGTIKETAAEMAWVLGIPCVRIAPNKPIRRQHLAPQLHADEAGKLAAIAEAVRERQAAGQPVLVGTRSVRASLAVGEALARAGIEHKVLNALQDADEAALVASAGQAGAVTVATNMAGRGTDIRLSREADALGLHVILTEWHESSRIDRQLWGRCARQGDPGSVRAIVSLEDELLQRHAGACAVRLARLFAGHAWPFWAIELLRRHVQSTAERANARQRRQTLLDDRRMRQQLAFTGGPE